MRILRLVIVALVVAALVATQGARFLVVDNPERSDAIVVLAGDTSARPARGLELLRQGMATHLFLDVEGDEEIYDQKLTGIAQRYLGSLPEAEQLSVCAIEGRSTLAETADVANCLRPMGARRVLIVTSDFHSRRALAIFSQRLPQYHWSMAAARNPAVFGKAWWTHREWAKTTVEEWAKLIWWEGVDRWR